MIKPRYYRAKGISIYLGVTITTVWNYAKCGKLKAIKLSDHTTVFDINQVDEFVANSMNDVA